MKRQLLLWNQYTAYAANLSSNSYTFYFEGNGKHPSITIDIMDLKPDLYGVKPEQYKLWRGVIMKYHNIIYKTGGTIYKKGDDFIVNKDAHVHIHYE